MWLGDHVHVSDSRVAFQKYLGRPNSKFYKIPILRIVFQNDNEILSM